MKNLNEYLTEMLSEPIFDEILNATISFIDQMYQEGVVAYNDESLTKIVNRKQKPDYKDICNGILSEVGGLSKKVQAELEKYIKSGSKEVEQAINSGIDKYCNEINL